MRSLIAVPEAFLRKRIPLQAPHPVNWSLLDGYENKTPCLDIGSGSHPQNTRPEENSGGNNCQKLEANRGSDAAEGVQPRTVFGLTLAWALHNQRRRYRIEASGHVRGPLFVYAGVR